MGLSLTEYSTSAAAAIAAGSVVEIAGAFFTFASDETINASSWTAITTGTTAYIALTPSGTAGSQVVTAAYTATAPTWRDDLQGWYASAASSTRVIGTVYKAGATSYYPKYIYGPMQDNKYLANSLYSSGPVTASSSLSVSGYFYPSMGHAVTSSYIHSSSITQASIFSALSSAIPVTGDSIIVTGGIGTIIASRAYRSDSTTIVVYGQIAGTGITQTVLTASSAIVVTSGTSIAW